MFGTATSERATDPTETTLGRIPARTLRITVTDIIENSIEQREGGAAGPLQLGDISSSAEFWRLDSGGAYIGVSGTGLRRRPPPSTSVCDHRSAEVSNDSPELATSSSLSPIISSASSVHVDTHPSSAVSLPHRPQPDPQDHFPQSIYMSEPGTSTEPAGHKQPSDPDPRWTVGSDGFAEPNESPTEAFKVVSREQPPGWTRGRIRFIGYGIFLGILGRKHGNVTPGGTILRDGMRVWVDARMVKNLTLRTGDNFHTQRVIVEETREVTYLWTGDISLEVIPKNPF